jgi:hypothetical protein
VSIPARQMLSIWLVSRCRRLCLAPTAAGDGCRDESLKRLWDGGVEEEKREKKEWAREKK